MKQENFSSLDYAHKKKRTKRDIFLGETTILNFRHLLENMI